MKNFVAQIILENQQKDIAIDLAIQTLQIKNCEKRNEGLG